MRVLCVAFLTSGLLLLAAGCGGGGLGDLPELVPVSGTVTLDGKPLGGVTVTFTPVGSTRGDFCSGVTDASGRYELQTQGKHKGAAVGEFKVTCSKLVMPDGSDLPADAAAADVGGGDLLPPQYSEEPESILKATVPAGGGEINFELKSDG